MSSYEEWLNTFQFHGYRLGLERMESILAELGNPERHYPSLHVAGTNGKGSVCATCEAFAIASGVSCGFYSSPHLYRINERFRVNGKNIDDDSLSELVFRIKKLIDKGFELSYFEYTTVIAMLWFMEMQVDLAIFETGLGGRLDATNVLTPACSVITNISLEHQSWLGHGIDEIAFEKAGIIKMGVPVVSGVTGKPARDVIAEIAMQKKCVLFTSGRHFHIHETAPGIFDYKGIRFSMISQIKAALHGRHQADNLALALAAWEILTERCNFPNAVNFESAVKDGARKVQWPGRGEIISGAPFIILDGAHNPEGVSALAAMLDDIIPHDRKMFLLWACSDEGGDKDFVSMLHRLSERFERTIVTEPPGPRKPVSVGEWQQRLPEKHGMILEIRWETAFKKALSMAVTCTGGEGGVCVAGSLYLVGAVRHLWEEKGVELMP